MAETNLYIKIIIFFFENMKCDVGLMIDHDVTEKKNENKVGISSY